jgi:N-acetylglucosamine-6-phosphate deacetylase
LSEWERRTVAPPRRDLELEAMAEIAAGTRWIHSHSYRQDEILMLARMAQEYGIQIGTFQHVLEGYKVAEAVKASARGASSFADWWAYKFEVIDAIPESPAIMHEVGVNVSINSDSDEFARRLNTEAAKGIKYGGLSPHDALCMVTINPAFQLGIDGRVGSLEVGKDADFALWSGDPMIYTSRCEATWIDGREYFSLARDAALRASAAQERQRILQKLMAEGAGEAKPSEGGARRRGVERLASGELTLREAYRLGLYEEIDALWRSGIDPATAQPGVCGCWDIFFDESLRSDELEADQGKR